MKNRDIFQGFLKKSAVQLTLKFAELHRVMPDYHAAEEAFSLLCNWD